MPTIAVTRTHDLSTGTGGKTLDLKTVIKAAQTISSEIVLGTLLEKLIRIVIENAGAQKGFLLLEKDSQLFIEAVGSVEESDASVLSSIPVATNGHPTELPLSIINYVKRTRENVLISDAGKDSRFANDSYIQQNNPRSILCIPILDKGDFVGILYLENNLVSDAFTPERLEVMQILSSQSAISLQNARLYEELRRALTEVEQLTNELETRVQERTAELEAFSYSVSHDLRTPLRTIGGFSRILLEDHGGKLDAECRRLLDIICDSTRNMGQLIDDLLAFSRLGRQEMKLSNINMGELARSVVDEPELGVSARNVEINIGRLPSARGDPAMIRQVFANLLSNGIKFTQPGEKSRIEVGHRSEDSENTYYVKDNGVGFDMRYAEKMFGVFQRLHRTDEFEGTGVGLAIVQSIIQRHGGRVWAEGRVDEGATIFFTLPRGTKTW